MYRPTAFAEDDVSRLHRFIDDYPFASVISVINGRPCLAYVPVVLDRDVGGAGRLRFHLARANSVSEAPEGSALCFSFRGPDAYISPDWYVSAGLVPTWNYIVVEARGQAERLDRPGLERLLVDLSAQQEKSLAPKEPWTLDKVPPERLSMLLNAIVGFSVPIESLEGKFKLSQDKSAPDREGVVVELDRLGRGALARAMRDAGVR